jgi:hypothetical protein
VQAVAGIGVVLGLDRVALAADGAVVGQVVGRDGAFVVGPQQVAELALQRGVRRVDTMGPRVRS